MGLFGQSESKLDKELDSIDENLIYKKSLVADDSNFEMAMQATNPNTLVELVIKNSKKQVDNINNRISQFNNF